MLRSYVGASLACCVRAYMRVCVYVCLGATNWFVVGWPIYAASQGRQQQLAEWLPFGRDREMIAIKIHVSLVHHVSVFAVVVLLLLPARDALRDTALRSDYSAVICPTSSLTSEQVI